MNKKYYQMSFGAILAVAALTGCGGSSGDVSQGPGSSNPPGTLNVRGDLSPSVGQSVALVATYQGDRSDSATIKWTQASGTPLELVATDSAILAFDIKTAGSYQFSVEYTTNNGTKTSKDVSFTTSNATNVLNVRRDHVARENNKVSLKLSAPINPDSGDVVDGEFTNVRWTQTGGPTVSLDSQNTNERLAIFNAPSVSSDQLVTFSVSALHPNGSTYTDEAYVLVQDVPTITDNALFDSTVARVKAYDKTSSRANALENCIYANNFALNSCSISSVNLIGQDHSAPSVDDIMERVLVSHQWMGDNFKLFLENEDTHGDFKRLLRSVSAIVISYDIRPSFYWTATGAIYLDPEDLWLTPTQRDVIDVAPDYRSAFGSELKYIFPWRYVKGDKHASSRYRQELRIDRTTKDIIPDLASLLYHELAHANDVFPSTSFDQIDQSTLFSEAVKRRGSTIADKLDAAYPKSSAEMKALAQVNFRGETPTATQIGYLPEDIVNFYSNDSAPTEYAYLTLQEDTATLFDATMMSFRYQIERDQAVTPPFDSTVGPDSLNVVWGQRGRIKDQAVEPRVKFVLERLMPELNAAQILADLPPVRQLRENINWYESIELLAPPDGRSGARFAPLRTKEVEIRPIESYTSRRYE